MRRSFLVAIVALAIGATGPGFGSANAENRAFDDWFVATAHQAAADPNYKRIPLDTTAQTSAFIKLTHRLYDGEITAGDFVRTVDDLYPGHEYEANFLIQHLPRR